MGIFRTIRVEDGIPLHLEAHLDKLKREVGRSVCPHAIRDYMASQGSLSGIWRLRITVSEKITFSLQPYMPYNQAYKIAVYPEPWEGMKIKSTSFGRRFKLIEWAKERGCDEALTINSEGFILEGAFCNLFFEDEKGFCFVDRSLPYYEGLTQEMIIQDQKQKVRFAKFSEKDLYGKKIYLCSSMKGIVQAVKSNHF